MAQSIKQIKNINYGIVGSVAVGIALFGAIIYAIRRSPSNAVTDVVKKAADVVAS